MQKFVFVSETCSFVGEVVVESQCRIIEAIATMLIVGRFSIRRFRFLKTTNQGNYERTDLSFWPRFNSILTTCQASKRHTGFLGQFKTWASQFCFLWSQVLQPENGTFPVCCEMLWFFVLGVSTTVVRRCPGINTNLPFSSRMSVSFGSWTIQDFAWSYTGMLFWLVFFYVLLRQCSVQQMRTVHWCRCTRIVSK